MTGISLDLDTLDALDTRFRSEDGKWNLRLDREEWGKLGRPDYIWIDVTPYRYAYPTE